MKRDPGDVPQTRGSQRLPLTNEGLFEQFAVDSSAIWKASAEPTAVCGVNYFFRRYQRQLLSGAGDSPPLFASLVS
jgi:hypothetical protein